MLSIFFILLYSALVISVDHSKFKTCKQSGFCSRLSALPSNQSRIKVNKLMTCENGIISAELLQNDVDHLLLRIEALTNGRVRVKLDEESPFHPRLDIFKDLWKDIQPEPVIDKSIKTYQYQNYCEMIFPDNQVVRLESYPTRIVYLKDQKPVISINSNDLLYMEPHIRFKSKQSTTENDNKPTEEVKIDSESFGSATDSLSRGYQAISFDVRFHNFQHVFGIPQHADAFDLRMDRDEPYRLFNLDVFEYELESPMAIYGSLPYLFAHNSKHSVGFAALNAAETWVKLRRHVTTKKFFIFSDYSTADVDSHWISESGLIDFFIFLADSPKEISRKYAETFGFPQLPPLFSLGYHQSRWNYNDQEDVKSVNQGFDEHDIPVDFLWLDIEYTDGRRYFTFDPIKFSDPIAMQKELSDVKRKLVAIIDCHVKMDDNYFVYKEAKERDFLIKTASKSNYDGWCWPGSSVYPDFLNPQVRDWWSGLYSFDIFKGSTNITHIWNDMNEPSVFSGPEVTLPKDTLHMNGWENRDVHNIYGFFFHLSTYEGLLKRNPNYRPFVLSRSFFLGSQKYTSVWTGDNKADWGHLKASIPMVLSLNLAGIVFSGADIGGFFGNPSEEMLVRWYQVGAFQPFFRAHSHIETKRREPWLFSAEIKKAIRDAIAIRYSFLPYWYTLFFYAHTRGTAVMRPLWYEYPTDEKTFSLEDEYLIGDALLIKPVTSSGVSHVSVYFPNDGMKNSTIWYDLSTSKTFKSGETVTVDAPLTKIPVFQRSGTIISKWERLRRSSEIMKNDPYTLEICVDTELTAEGELYLDDGSTLNHQRGIYKLVAFKFLDKRLSSRILKDSHDFSLPISSRIERIIVNGDHRKFTKASIQAKDSLIRVDVIPHLTRPGSYVIRDPKVKVDEPFVILLS